MFCFQFRLTPFCQAYKGSRGGERKKRRVSSKKPQSRGGGDAHAFVPGLFFGCAAVATVKGSGCSLTQNALWLFCFCFGSFFGALCFPSDTPEVLQGSISGWVFGKHWGLAWPDPGLPRPTAHPPVCPSVRLAVARENPHLTRLSQQSFFLIFNLLSGRKSRPPLSAGSVS